MSGDEVIFAIEVIDELFKDPTWIDHNQLASLTMLNLTTPELNYLFDYINTKLYKYDESASLMKNSLRRSVKGS